MRNKLIILSLLFTFYASAAYAQHVPSDLRDPDISIYPNPAASYIVVEFKGDVKNTEFELNSMIGNKLRINPEEIGLGKYKISLKDFATGYYFLVVKDESKRFKKAFKFLKH